MTSYIPLDPYVVIQPIERSAEERSEMEQSAGGIFIPKTQSERFHNEQNIVRGMIIEISYETANKIGVDKGAIIQYIKHSATKLDGTDLLVIKAEHIVCREAEGVVFRKVED